MIINSGYEPVKIVSWQKAIVLWLQNRVEVLEFHQEFVYSSHRSFKLPAVIKLNQYIRPYFHVKDRPTRQQVFKRDDQICQYCEDWFPIKELTIDHVIAISRGGKHTWDNVVTACCRCNNRKGNRSLKQLGWSLLRPPLKPTFLVGDRIENPKKSIPEVWRPFLDPGAA